MEEDLQEDHVWDGKTSVGTARCCWIKWDVGDYSLQGAGIPEGELLRKPGPAAGFRALEEAEELDIVMCVRLFTYNC